MGHVHLECESGEFKEDELQFGDLMLTGVTPDGRALLVSALRWEESREVSGHRRSGVAPVSAEG